MNIKQIITVGVAGVAMGAMALDNVEVTDVKARQRYPWNGKVDIDFTLDSKATEPYQMQVEVYDNVGKTNLPVKSVCTENVSVEANPCMVRTDTTRIVWDAAKDLPNGFKCTNVLVSCRDARTIAVSNLYCVINLTTGEKEYLSSIPAGGWTDEHKTTKMVFRRIEAGSFMMGSPASEVGRQSNETQHKVTITKPYYISVFELTEAQYANIKGESSESIRPKLLEFGRIRGCEWGYDHGASGFQWPISTKVSASSLVGVLRIKTGINTIDLPTEAKWEKACRGLTTTPVNNGCEANDYHTSLVARYDGNCNDHKGDSSSSTTTIVGMYKPNSLGLYDMLGNSLEWCLDVYTSDLGTMDATDPIGNDKIICGHATTNTGWPVNSYTSGSTYSVMRVVKGGGSLILIRIISQQLLT